MHSGPTLLVCLPVTYSSTSLYCYECSAVRYVDLVNRLMVFESNMYVFGMCHMGTLDVRSVTSDMWHHRETLAYFPSQYITG